MSFLPGDHLLSNQSTLSPKAPLAPLLPAYETPAPHDTRAGATSLASPEHLSLRSCFTCRRRKVRCNKRSPCSNCAKGGIECIYPPPGRARRKTKQPQEAELLSRLKRLEGVIETLRGNIASEEPSVPSVTDVTIATAQGDDTASSNQLPSKENGALPQHVCSLDIGNNYNNSQKELQTGLGRLVIEDGRSRYVNNRLWTSLGDEVEELQDILDPTSSEDEDSPASDSNSTRSSGHDSFLFSFYPLSHSLRRYHPPPEKILILWDAYQENVAPLVTVVHRQIAKRRLMAAAERCDMLDKNSEALVFSIYLAAAMSMSAEECLNKLGEGRDVAVKRYRFATEQALAKANILNTQSLVLLQAAVLFLIGVRRVDDSKFVWSMTAVVLRLAQGLGLHRDGTNFRLNPFETEMRRRIWWHITVLDIRSSEDHGTDFQIHDGTYDTRLPLNVNDEDLSPEMQIPPSERAGCTDMTFSLIRFEITNALRRVSYSSPRARFIGNNDSTPGDCGEMIRSINDRIEQRYLRYCDMSIPLHWICATVARLILAKLWLIIHHPMTAPHDPRRNLTQETRENLFLASIEVIEFTRLMESNEHTAKWGWMSQTNTPWHAVAFVLSELCVRPVCPITDRAWAAVCSVYRELDHKQKKGMLWRPLSRLVKRAASIRARQREQLQAHFGDRPVHDLSQQTGAQNFAIGQISTMPLPLQGPSSIYPGVSSRTDSETNAGTSKEPNGALSSFFPSVDTLGGSHIPSATSQQQLVSANALASMPHSAAVPVDNRQGMASVELNWKDWNQVMRDFQMDIQRAEVAHQMDNSSDWLA